MTHATLNPLHRYRLMHQYRPKTTPFIDAPTPWHTVRYFSELTAILDATGFTVTVCRPEHAERIVAAVNEQEATS